MEAIGSGMGVVLLQVGIVFIGVEGGRSQGILVVVGISTGKPYAWHQATMHDVLLMMASIKRRHL